MNQNKKIFIARLIPDRGINLLLKYGYDVVVSPKDGVLTKEELTAAVKGKNFDAVLCLLTDKIDADILTAAGPQVKIFANYAVGFDNIDLKAASEKGIMVTNTPDVLTETVAEHTFALMLAIAHRIAEADKFMRAGKYVGWAPMLLLGTDLTRKTLAVVGLGRIGSRVVEHAVRGFEMKVLYYDPKRNEQFEKDFNAVYAANLDDLLRQADFVSIHVPLLPATQHLINADRFKIMKRSAYLINTSRGPIVDEKALADALKQGVIRGAAIDVFEQEPQMEPALKDLDNIIVTPHIASATEETRQKMSEVAAMNIIEALEGRTPPNLIKIS